MNQCRHCGAQFEQYEVDESDLICPTCGWSVSAADPLKRARISGNIPLPSLRKARAIGIAMVVAGLPLLFGIIGIIEIVLGIGIARLKRRSYQNAMTLMRVEIGLGLFAIVGGIGLSIWMANLVGPARSDLVAGVLSRNVVLGIIGGYLFVVGSLLLIALKRPSVDRAFWASGVR